MQPQATPIWASTLSLGVRSFCPSPSGTKVPFNRTKAQPEGWKGCKNSSTFPTRRSSDLKKPESAYCIALCCHL